MSSDNKFYDEDYETLREALTDDMFDAIMSTINKMSALNIEENTDSKDELGFGELARRIGNLQADISEIKKMVDEVKDLIFYSNDKYTKLLEHLVDETKRDNNVLREKLEKVRDEREKQLTEMFNLISYDLMKED